MLLYYSSLSRTWSQLSFQDAVILAQEINKNLALRMDIGEYRYLRHYERSQKQRQSKC